MSVARKRKQEALRLGLELSKRYERLVNAGNDPDEITVASVDLGVCFNDNIEFILWVLKTFGGAVVSPPEKLRQVAPPPPANDLPKTPAIFLNGKPH